MSRSGLLPSNPIETFMRLFRLSFPDAPGCAALYFSKIDGGLRLAWLDQENEFIPFQSRILNALLLNKKIRDTGISRQISWHKFSPLPSEIRKVLRSQPEVFDSGIDDILIFRNQNAYDEKMDLIFFDFRKWMISGKRSKGYDLSDEKVKKTFVDSLSAFYKSIVLKHEEDFLKWEIILNNSQTLVLENQQLKLRIESYEQEKRENRLNLVRKHLERISGAMGIRFALRPDAENKIMNFSGPEEQLLKALQRAITFAREINSGGNDVVFLAEQHIHFNESGTYYLEIDSNHQSGGNKFTKTVQLLDRFEKAALIVKSRNEKLTSANLGKYCKPNTISPPGIRDAIKNHHENILYLLEKRQGEWNTIRNEFKPILNLIREKT